MMMSVSTCRKSWYSIFTETQRPRRIEMRFTSSFCAGEREALEHAALAQQVAEHEEAHERQRVGRDETGDDADDHGEENLGRLGDRPRVVGHADAALALGGHGLTAMGWMMGTRAM